MVIVEMNKFDPINQRRVLLDVCGFSSDLRHDFEQAKSVGGLATSAHAFLGTATKCTLVGLYKPAIQLLQKASIWLRHAISHNERPQRYFLDGTEAQRFHDLAICNWLLHGQHDEQNLDQFVRHEDIYLNNSGAWRDRVNMSLTLPGYVNAGAYQEVLDWFARTPRSRSPKDLGCIRDEGQMSYVICRFRLGLEYSDSEVAFATDKFLTRNMDGWLGSGHLVSTAEWMKIIYWKDGKTGLSPRDAILKSYQHLPGRLPPTSAEGAHRDNCMEG
jgi:hypothetical protein